LADYKNYAVGWDGVWWNLEPLARIARKLKDHGIDLLVICPYEYQLRESKRSERIQNVFLPKRLVRGFLESKGIPYRDAADFFLARARSNGARFFLPFDPMHFY
jgi:hypothetical protein